MYKHLSHLAHYKNELVGGVSIGQIIDHTIEPNSNFTERIVLAVITAVIIPFVKDLSEILINKLKGKKSTKKEEKKEAENDSAPEQNK